MPDQRTALGSRKAQVKKVEKAIRDRNREDFVWEVAALALLEFSCTAKGTQNAKAHLAGVMRAAELTSPKSLNPQVEEDEPTDSDSEKALKKWAEPVKRI